MTNTWDNSMFKAVEKTIHNCLEHTNKRTFEWTFPRQCGVTTYFANRVVDDVLAGRSVAIFGMNQDNTNTIRQRVVENPLLQGRDLHTNTRRELRLEAGGVAHFFTVNTSNNNWMLNLRGRSLDRIYLDNWIWNTNTWDRIEFNNIYVPTIAVRDGYILALNTTEG